MDIEQQSAVLRAMRAWADLDQSPAAEGAGVGWKTLIAAEKGRQCSDKTWAAMLAFYASKGIHWRGGEGPCVIVFTA